MQCNVPADDLGALGGWEVVQLQGLLGEEWYGTVEEVVPQLATHTVTDLLKANTNSTGWAHTKVTHHTKQNSKKQQQKTPPKATTTTKMKNHWCPMAHTHTCTHTHTHACTHTLTHTHSHTHTYLHTHTHMHSHTYAHMHTLTHACMHAHTQIMWFFANFIQ